MIRNLIRRLSAPPHTAPDEPKADDFYRVVEAFNSVTYSSIRVLVIQHSDKGSTKLLDSNEFARVGPEQALGQGHPDNASGSPPQLYPQGLTHGAGGGKHLVGSSSASMRMPPIVPSLHPQYRAAPQPNSLSSYNQQVNVIGNCSYGIQSSPPSQRNNPSPSAVSNGSPDASSHPGTSVSSANSHGSESPKLPATASRHTTTAKSNFDPCRLPTKAHGLSKITECIFGNSHFATKKSGTIRIHSLVKPDQYLLSVTFTLTREDLEEVNQGHDQSGNNHLEDRHTNQYFPQLPTSVFAIALVVDNEALPDLSDFLKIHHPYVLMRIHEAMAEITRALARAASRQFTLYVGAVSALGPEEERLRSTKGVPIAKFKARQLQTNRHCRAAIDQLLEYLRTMYSCPRLGGAHDPVRWVRHARSAWKEQPTFIATALCAVMKSQTGWIKRMIRHSESIGENSSLALLNEDVPVVPKIYSRIIVFGSDRRLVQDLLEIMPYFIDDGDRELHVGRSWEPWSRNHTTGSSADRGTDHNSDMDNYVGEVEEVDGLAAVQSHQNLNSAWIIVPDSTMRGITLVNDFRSPEKPGGTDSQYLRMERDPVYGPENVFGATGVPLSELIPPRSMIGRYYDTLSFVPDFRLVGVRAPPQLAAIQAEFDIYRKYFFLAFDKQGRTAPAKRVQGNCLLVDVDSFRVTEVLLSARYLSEDPRGHEEGKDIWMHVEACPPSEDSLVGLEDVVSALETMMQLCEEPVPSLGHVSHYMTPPEWRASVAKLCFGMFESALQQVLSRLLPLATADGGEYQFIRGSTEVDLGMGQTFVDNLRAEARVPTGYNYGFRRTH